MTISGNIFSTSHVPLNLQTSDQYQIESMMYKAKFAWLLSFILRICQLGLLGTASVCTHHPLVLCMLLVECAQLDLIELSLESGANLCQVDRLHAFGLLISVMPERYIVLQYIPHFSTKYDQDAQVAVKCSKTRRNAAVLATHSKLKSSSGQAFQLQESVFTKQ